MFKSIKRYLKSTSGNTLAEFAVTTAMMATLATTAAPKFSGVGEGAKEKKTLADIEKLKAIPNVQGCIVGRAILDNKINLSEIFKFQTASSSN